MFHLNKTTEEGNARYLQSVSSGRIIDLDMLDDEIYSSKILGDGYGIFPVNNKVFSPADCLIEKISNNGHSFNIKTDDGLLLLIHIGKNSKCDTMLPVNVMVNEGERVNAGQLLCEFSCCDNKEECVIEVVVTNSERLSKLKILTGVIKQLQAPAIEYSI